jgi:hypothetical protein
MSRTVRGARVGLCTCVRPLLGPARQTLVFLFRPAESTTKGRRLDWRSQQLFGGVGPAATHRYAQELHTPLCHGVSDGGDPCLLIGGRYKHMWYLERGGPALALLKLNSL